MKKTELVKYKVTAQGAIVVNNVIMYKKSNTVCAIIMDTKNKWGEVLSDGSNENNIPCIDLDVNENTTNLLKGKTIADATEIEFVDFKGWNIFCSSWSKYSVCVCLVKDNVVEHK